MNAKELHNLIFISVLSISTEAAHTKGKTVSAVEDSPRDRKVGGWLSWKACFSTPKNPPVAPGKRHPNKSFPSVISLTLWLILRRIRETSWLVPWPWHLDVQAADRFISRVPLGVGVTGKDTAELCKCNHSNSLWISLEHLKANLPPYLWSISLSGRIKGLHNKKRDATPLPFSDRSTNELDVWPLHAAKGQRWGKAELGATLPAQGRQGRTEGTEADESELANHRRHTKVTTSKVFF